MAGLVAEIESTGKESLEYNITRFAQILRHLGVRASLAETMDAMVALSKIDMVRRDQVRGALRACLAKSRREAEIFDQAFDLFFTTPEEKKKRREMLREKELERAQIISGAENELMEAVGDWQEDLPETVVFTDTQLETFAMMPEAEKERMKDILERMKSNPVNNPAELINRVLQSSLNYWRYYMMKNLAGMDERPGLEAELTGDSELDDVIKTVAAYFYHTPGDSMLHRDMEKLDDGDIPRISSLISRMSSRILLGMGRRYKKSTRAVAVDIRRTVRRNICYGGIPVYLRYRSRRRKKPKFLLICDVSASMAKYARFVIQFIYGLGSALSGMENFIFSEDLERITRHFIGRKSFAQSMAEVINSSAQWGKSTNLAQSLKTFNSKYRDLLTPETIVFVVSDTKTVSPGPAAEMLEKIKLRCADMVWLNTLPAREWANQPQVKIFARIARMYECNTLSQLEKAVQRHVSGMI